MSKSTLHLPRNISFDKDGKTKLMCPNCNSSIMSVFYSVEDIPVHSCLLISSRTKALKTEKGNLNLALCHTCGFITNICFDPITQKYSAQYEETQAFSACFNAFAKSLAQRLIDRYDIHKKTILEIGCGKGEFLALMCLLGDNRGIGIDPAYVPQRNPDTENRIEFLQEFFSEKHSSFKADVICCRHTLEHIKLTREFLRTIRRTIEDRNKTLVFFELPDFMRVLEEGAFWDIYYEHCSYFTTETLVSLFQNCGFEVEDIYLDYDGQYLMLTAYPAEGPNSASNPVGDDLEFLTDAIDTFRDKCYQRIDYWQRTIQQIAHKGERLILWGSGSKAVSFLTTLKVGGEIEYVVDINPFKHGKYMPGAAQRIVAPQFLTEYRPQKVIIMNPIYYDEIQRNLDHLNVRADLLTL